MKSERFRFLARGAVLALTYGAIGAACAMADEMAPVPEIQPGVLAGYLPRAALPDSVALLPPPPAEGSAALAMDHEISQGYLVLEGSPRWKLAGMDANLSFPWAAGDFSCAMNAPVTQTDTPRLYQLLRRVMSDAGASTRAAKDNYKRQRPFMVNKAATCTPGAEEHLAQDGSYPSGHTAIGWTWALILSEIAPDQAQAILARGRAFGQSRVVCNVHWQSDTIESLELAAGTVARLHDDPTFVADLDAAKSEIAAAHAKKLAPQRNCKAEADALAQQPPQAP
ncbi:MAG TPA: phosphatase PAP2 family protein [Roseiarcus sp.]|jgi:acid phosphatase (class A)